jgi:hypothetical protein
MLYILLHPMITAHLCKQLYHGTTYLLTLHSKEDHVCQPLYDGTTHLLTTHLREFRLWKALYDGNTKPTDPKPQENCLVQTTDDGATYLMTHTSRFSCVKIIILCHQLPADHMPQGRSLVQNIFWWHLLNNMFGRMEAWIMTDGGNIACNLCLRLCWVGFLCISIA